MDCFRARSGSQALFSKRMSCESNQKGLTAPDFLLWGFRKDKVFATNSQTLAELKDKITEEIGRIDAATMERAMEGMLSRARSCVAHNGCHLTDVVFHAWKYKTSVHSLSFEVSFVLIGTIERLHDKNKSASRLLGHPVYIYLIYLSIYFSYHAHRVFFYVGRYTCVYILCVYVRMYVCVCACVCVRYLL